MTSTSSPAMSVVSVGDNLDDLDTDLQDLGDDFHFESDPLALASILNNRGLSPKLRPQAFTSTLTPASKLNKRQMAMQDKYDFFEGKNGSVFYRPSAKFSASAKKKAAPNSGSKQRAMERGVLQGKMPKRINNNNLQHCQTTTITQTPSNCFKRPLIQGPKSEKRFLPLIQTQNRIIPFPRQSISERKAIQSVRKTPKQRPQAIKSLQFESGKKQKENKKSTSTSLRKAKDEEESTVNFAKPLSPFKAADEKSKAELIMMREGLVGLPRESLSALLRQSLSKAELDKMFEDDSTANFEKLEFRLKTPKAKKCQSKISRNKDENPPKGQINDCDEPSQEMKQDVKVPQCEEISQLQEKQHDEQNKIFEDDSTANFEKIEFGFKTPKAKNFESKICRAKDENLPEIQINDYDEPSQEMKQDVKVLQCAETSHIQEEPPHEKPVPQGEEISQLQKSMSMMDIKKAVECANSSDKESGVPKSAVLLKSSSAIDLRDESAKVNLELCSAAKAIVEWRRNFVQEQAEIERKTMEIMERQRKRRQEFKMAWGVSPRNVGKVKSMKTVIMRTAQIVRMSPKTAETERVFKTPEKKKDVLDSSQVLNVEDQIFSPQIHSQEYLDETIPLGNVEEVDLERGEPQDSVAESPNSQEEDYFMPEESQKQFLEGLIGGGKLLENVNFSPFNADLSSASFNDVETNEEMAMEITRICEEEEEQRPGEDVSSPLKTANRKKTVRFLNATPNPNPDPDPGDVDEFAPIGVHLPVTIAGKSGHIGFTKKRRSSNVILHNPTPGLPNRAKSRLEEPDQPAANRTPAALREISNRAQSALASLYEDISDDEFHPPGCVGCVKGKLDFDE